MLSEIFLHEFFFWIREIDALCQRMHLTCSLSLVFLRFSQVSLLITENIFKVIQTICKLTESFFIFATRVRTCDGTSLKTQTNKKNMMKKDITLKRRFLSSTWFNNNKNKLFNLVLRNEVHTQCVYWERYILPYYYHIYMLSDILQVNMTACSIGMFCWFSKRCNWTAKMK